MRQAESERSAERFVSNRVERLGLHGPRDYVDLIRREDEEGKEFSELTTVVAVGYTRWFRDPVQIEAMALALEEIHRTRNRPPRIWNPACSTGQETWSVVMAAAERDIPVDVLATDINYQSLKRARRGAYGPGAMHGVSADRRERFFRPHGDNQIIKDSLKQRVTWGRHNLMRPAPPGPWDAVLCRNALIYFAPATVAAVCSRLVNVLVPGGWIFLGASESLLGMRLPVEPVELLGRILYRRSSGQEVPVIPEATTRPPIPPLPQRTTKRRARRRASWSQIPELMRDGQHDDARNMAETIVNTNEGTEEDMLTYGNLLLRDHAFDQALRTYVDVQKRAPLDPEPHYLQGVAYRKLGDLNGAKEALRRALFLDPRFWPASFLLAGVYGRMGRDKDQKRELRRTLDTLQSGHRLRWTGHTDGIPALQLDATQVAAACDQLLS